MFFPGNSAFCIVTADYQNPGPLAAQFVRYRLNAIFGEKYFKHFQ
jgi:hypothetical protein